MIIFKQQEGSIVIKLKSDARQVRWGSFKELSGRWFEESRVCSREGNGRIERDILLI